MVGSGSGGGGAIVDVVACNYKVNHTTCTASIIVNINDSVGSFLSCAVFLGWLPSYSETIGGRVRWRVEGTVYCNKEGQRCVCMVCDVLV